VNDAAHLRHAEAALLALAIALGVGYLAAAIGPVVLLLALAATACACLTVRRDWLAPAVMFICVAVPAGYPFELAFRVPLRFASISLTEGMLTLALVATIGARPKLPGDEDYRFSPWARVALVGMLLSILLGLVVGVAYGQATRGEVRDVRPLFLYAAALLPLVPNRRVHFHRLLTMLVLGMTFIAALQVACLAVSPLHQFFLADRLRVWFGNGVLYPLALPLAIALALQANRLRRVYFWVSCAVVIVTGLTLSQTRSHWILTLLSLAVFGLLVLLRRGRVRRSVLGVSASLCVVLTAAGLFIVLAGGGGLARSAVDGLLLRAKTLRNPGQDSSLSTRAIQVGPANAMILSHPLVGTGLGTTFQLRGRSGLVYSTSGAYVDNVLQTLLVKVGVLGATPFVLFWFLAGRRAWRLRWMGTPVAAACAASVPGMAVMLFASSYLVAGSQIAAIALLAGVLLRGRDSAIDSRDGALRG